MQRFLKYAAFVLGVFILITSSATAATYIPLDDSVYDILLRLEAEGVIQSGLLTTRPLSRREVVRLIREAERSGSKSPFVEKLTELLKEISYDELGDAKFIKPVDFVYARYLYSDSKLQELYYNNDGDKFKKGSNLRFGFSSNAEFGLISFYVNPEFRYSYDEDESQDKDEDTIIKTGYGVLSFWGLELQAGKDSQWWGPGHHGAILLSNNSEPLTMIKLSNPQPVLLPWIFKYLGPFRFTFFEAKLENYMDLSEPYLWGLRFNFKPTPYLEAGIQRTALLSGNGGAENIDALWKSFTGKSEDSSGDGDSLQKAGFDVKLTVPFKWQPFQLYLEAGEDEPKILQSKWSYLAGLYLPRIFYLERLDFKVEYARNYISSDYNYEGRMIGHHMGTDSSDMFFEMNYHVPELNGKVNVSYDIEEHNLSGDSKPTKTEASVGLKFDLTKAVSIDGKYTLGEVKNTNNVNDDDGKINLFMLNLEYYF